MPVATGMPRMAKDRKIVQPTPPTGSPHAGGSSSPRPATSRPPAVISAANANNFTCWRSLPRDRRKRSTRESAARMIGGDQDDPVRDVKASTTASVAPCTLIGLSMPPEDAELAGLQRAHQNGRHHREQVEPQHRSPPR